MEPHTVFPDAPVMGDGPVSRTFLKLDVNRFLDACRFVHELPYGYNSDRDDLMILFKENMGSCATKHAVIATLAVELHLPIAKNVAVYPMTEGLVTGTGRILARYTLPYLPMIHCFLAYGTLRVDLTEGNRNGKNRPVDRLLHVREVEPHISARDEYLLYRQALKEEIVTRPEFRNVDLKRILHAREEGLALLKANIQ
jgi:hypothetical protein